MRYPRQKWKPTILKCCVKTTRQTSTSQIFPKLLEKPKQKTSMFFFWFWCWQLKDLLGFSSPKIWGNPWSCLDKKAWKFLQFGTWLWTGGVRLTDRWLGDTSKQVREIIRQGNRGSNFAVEMVLVHFYDAMIQLIDMIDSLCVCQCVSCITIIDTAGFQLLNRRCAIKFRWCRMYLLYCFSFPKPPWCWPGNSFPFLNLRLILGRLQQPHPTEHYLSHGV